MAFEHDTTESYGRSRSQGAAAVRETLEEAQQLAAQIERLLTSPRCTFPETDAFRVRLARAHTLSLLDQLSELLGPGESAPGTRRTVRDEDAHATSGIRPAWR
jgi:hypothetical protein